MRLKPHLALPKVFLSIGAGSLAFLTALAVASPPAAAEDARNTPAKRPAKTTATPVVVRVISVPLQECPADDREGMSAVRAFVDPVTGELRAPTAEEQEALSRVLAPRAARQAQTARQILVSPEGIVSYELGEDGMEDVVARVGADGKPVFLCTPRSETPKALTRPLAPKKSDAAKEEK